MAPAVVLALAACKPPVAEQPSDLPPLLPATRVWHGTEAQDEAGGALDVAVMDGDDAATLLVGTPSSITESIGPYGGAYLLPPGTQSGLLDDVAAASFVSESWNAFGSKVVLAGDLTGDGASDLVVHGSGGSVVESATNHVFASPFGLGATVADAWVSIRHDGSSDTPGEVKRCGDLNADNVDELCIASWGGVDRGSVAKAVVFYGPLPEGVVQLDDASVVVEAPLGGCFGKSLAGGSDLDGDGAVDLLAGSTCLDESAGGFHRLSDLGVGTRDLDEFPTWTGEPGDGRAGQSLTVGGDLDGDGLPDLFASAPQWDERGGRGYVVVDKDGGSLADAHAIIDGEPGDWTGFDAAIADWNGDGHADLAVGAPRDIYFAFDRPGRVAVFLGPIAPGPYALDDADLVFSGSTHPDAFGMTVEAGDVDGDGRDDLVVGAPKDSTHQPTSGAVYVFSGMDLFP